MKLKPLADRLIVRPVNAETISEGGIYIPPSAQEKPQRGEVVAAGAGRVADNGALIALTVKVGDIVLYGRYSGTEIEEENKTVIILRESDVLAVVGK